MAFEICFGSAFIIAAFVFVVLVLLATFYALSIYNGLISLRINVDKSWANIDVVLKQRTDLIPNLVEIVKGYMKHEKSVLEDITKLRVQMLGANTPGQKAKVSEAISAGLKSIFAVAENYPKLMASDNFLELQKQLAAMENQIADRREFYNDSVALYNARIQSLPDSLVAGILGMKQKEYFKVEEADKQAVEVKI